MTLTDMFKELNLSQIESEDNKITHLICEIINEKSSEIVLKLFSEDSDYSLMYLSDIIVSESIVNIKLLGSKRKQSRETYDIEINFEQRKIACSCKDYTFRCQKYGIVCKHITFIVTKVANIYDVRYFNTTILSDDNINKLREVLNTNTLNTSLLSIKGINKDFKSSNKEFNEIDKCPICCDYFQTKKECLSCPICFNFVHKNCMDIWFENSNKCVYCRSVWSNYINKI
jgi:hypothetical protein